MQTRGNDSEGGTMHSGKQFRTWLDALDDMVHVVDRDLRLIFFNEALRNMMKAHGMQPFGIGDRLDGTLPFLQKVEIDNYERVFRTGAAYRTEYECQLENGVHFCSSVRLTPVFNQHGEVDQVVTIITEITKRKDTEETLRLSEKRYRAVVEDIPLFICRFRPDGVYTFVNDAYTRYYLRSRDELIGANIYSFIPAEKREAIRQMHLSRTPDDSVRVVTHPAIVPGRGLRWHRWTERAIFEDGRLVEFQSIGEDITEQHRMTEALRESEERYRIVSELVSDYAYCFRVKSGGKMSREWVTEAFRRITGFTPAEEEQRGGWLGIVHPDDLPIARRQIEAELAGKSEVDELRIVHKDGGVRWLRNYMFPVMGKNGKVERVYGAVQDITDHKLLERRIEELRSEYEAFMRHELKNLFIPLRLHADLLLNDSNGNYTPLQREELEKIRESTIQGTECIDSLRKIQELETGTRVLDLERAPLEPIIRNVLTDLALRGEKNGVEICFDCRAAHTELLLDPQLMPGVFFNLILNAIEHVEYLKDPMEKQVRIEMEVKDGILETRISNRGSPVPPERRAVFFEKFTASGKGHGRMGLGTAYAKLVTISHGGEIRVVSSKEHGTTVTVTLPIR